MKYAILVLISFLFLSFSSSLNSQVLDSDYIRQDETQGEVLGGETDVTLEEVIDEVDEVDEQEETFVQNRIIELFAIIGGVILVVLFAYIVYGKKVK